MRVIKYKVFEELIVDTTKTIENLKAGLVELEDLGFKVEVKWVKWNEILISIHDPRRRHGGTSASITPFNSSVIEDYILNLVDYCDDCTITYSYRIVGVGNDFNSMLKRKSISDTNVFPENETLNYFKMLIKINNCPIE
jgi:hypothetical protein